MNQFYKIAGLRVRMDTFGRTQTQATPYLCAPFEEADIEIQSNREAMKKWAPNLDDNDLEYMGTGTSFYRQLLNYDGLLLHSSAVMMDGEAYLFSAPSGTGKSTHTQLWLQVFGDRAKILNDDKPAMRLENGVWYAYGTPWSGKYDYSVNTKVPLAGICILSRGDENRILPYGGAKAIHDILTQTIRSSDADAMIKLLELLDQLVTAVPVWKMECTPDPEAARAAYRAMSGKEE